MNEKMPNKKYGREAPIMNKKTPNKKYTREVLIMNKKTPNNFIARENPTLNRKFIPYTIENFKNRVYYIEYQI